MLLKSEKQAIMQKYAVHEGDTGSPEVQIAVLTEEINRLTEHFKEHKHDFHSQRGLMKKVGRRKKLLAYLKGKNLDRYKALIAKLSLRSNRKDYFFLSIYLIEYKSMIEVKKWRNKSFI